MVFASSLQSWGNDCNVWKFTLSANRTCSTPLSKMLGISISLVHLMLVDSSIQAFS